MSSKLSHKASLQAHDSQVLNWAKRLWRAVSKESTYRQGHDFFFKEFKKLLRDASESQGGTKVTMLNHVAPIYNHIASQGYQAHIHYQPLVEAVSNYCVHKPVSDWKGPDQSSRSPSTNLETTPPPPTNQPKISPMIATNTRLLRKRGKAEVISEEVVRSDHDDSEGEPKPRTKLPSTDGMELNPTKCGLCEQRFHLCHVNPKATKAAAACFECNYRRVKCSLTPARTKKGEAPAEQKASSEPEQEEEVAASKEPAPKRRKKPTQVPAGHPGQFDAASLPVALGPEILKRLESCESGNQQLLEKIEVLTQNIIQLTSENRLMRESISKRDEVIGAAMQSILENVEKMSRQFGLREAVERMEALLKVPADVEFAFKGTAIPTPTPTRSLPPFLRLPATLMPETASSTMPEFPDEPSNTGKRPVDKPHSESKKRRKI